MINPIDTTMPIVTEKISIIIYSRPDSNRVSTGSEPAMLDHYTTGVKNAPRRIRTFDTTGVNGVRYHCATGAIIVIILVCGIINIV